MVGPKKDTAYFSDDLALEGNNGATRPKFKVTMPDGSLPTLEQLQQIIGGSLDRAAKILEEMQSDD